MPIGVKTTCTDGNACLRPGRCIGQCAIVGMLKGGPARVGPVIALAKGGATQAQAYLDRAGVAYGGPKGQDDGQ